MAKQKRKFRVNKDRHMVVTPVGRVSFPQLFEAKAYENDPKKFYRVDLIFDSKKDLQEAYEGKKVQTPSLVRAIKNAKVDFWGKEKSKWPKFRFPNIRDGNDMKNDDGVVYEGYADKVFIRLKTGEKFPPKVIGKNGKPLEESEIYGGCFARAQIICSAYEMGPNYGVSLQLVSVLKEKDGDRFGVSDDVFDFEDDEDEETEDDSEDDFEDEDDDDL